MRRGKRDRRFGEIILGLILLMVALSAIGGDQFLPLLLGLGGLYLLARQVRRSHFSASERESRKPRESLDAEEDFIPQPPRALNRRAVFDAVRRSGLDPTETHVLPIDVGVMAFSGDGDPVIYRTRPVPDDVDYLQPFVQLRLPTRAHGRIRFEIIDSDGQTLFVRQEDHEFERGRNLITPAARLPIHDAHAMMGAWQLRISADDVLIADHRFEWQEDARKVIRRHLTEDGELSSEVRAMVAENRLQRMSLDELLEQPRQTQEMQSSDADGASQQARR